MSFFALGTGFLKGAEKAREEEKDESRERRKLSMELYIRDTLPRVRKAQEDDNQAMDLANTYLTDPRLSGNLPAAFDAAKRQRLGEVKNLDEYLAGVAGGKIEPNEEANKVFLEKASRYMSYQTDPNTGKVASFTLKPLEPAAPAPTAAAPRRSLGDIMTGRQSPARDMEESRQGFMKMTGVDPNAPISPRFQGIDTSMNTVQMVDKQKLARQMAIADMNLKDEEGLGDKYGQYMSIFENQGPEAANAYAAQNRIPTSKRKAMELQERMHLATVQAVIGNLDKLNPEGRALIAQGKLTPGNALQFATAYTMTPEQLEAIKRKNEKFSPNSVLDWKTLFASKDFEEYAPDPAERARLKLSVQAYQDAQEKNDFLRQLQLSGKTEEAAALGNQPVPPADPTKAGLSAAELEAWKKSQGVSTEPAAPAAAVDPNPPMGEVEIEAEEPKGPGFIEGTRKALADADYMPKLDNAIRTPGVDLSTFNPKDVVSRVTKIMSVPKERLPEIAKTLSITPEVQQELRSAPLEQVKDFYEGIDKLLINYLPEYGSKEEGEAATEDGRLFKYKQELPDGRKVYRWAVSRKQ